MPTPEEVEPWVETVIRLWDDESSYHEKSRRAWQRTRRWRPEQLGERYAEFITSLTA